MSLTNPSRPDAPIPGANYTSDTRNWPWHRPPDITDVDEALEYVMETLTETDAGMRYMGMVEGGLSLVSVADIVVTLGIGRGKWTPDFALLVAGPVTRMLEILAKSYKIEYDLGIEDADTFDTAVLYKKKSELLEGNSEEDPEKIEEIVEEEEPQGFLMMASEDEQSSMLGYDAEEEELEDE